MKRTVKWILNNTAKKNFIEDFKKKFRCLLLDNNEPKMKQTTLKDTKLIWLNSKESSEHFKKKK